MQCASAQEPCRRRGPPPSASCSRGSTSTPPTWPRAAPGRAPRRRGRAGTRRRLRLRVDGGGGCEGAAGAVVTLLSGYAARFLKDAEFSRGLRDKGAACLAPAAAAGQDGPGHAVLANLELGIKSVERLAAIGEAPREAKIFAPQLHPPPQHRRLAPRVVAAPCRRRDAEGRTCGVPNSHLAACAQLYLSVVDAGARVTPQATASPAPSAPLPGDLLRAHHGDRGCGGAAPPALRRLPHLPSLRRSRALSVASAPSPWRRSWTGSGPNFYVPENGELPWLTAVTAAAPPSPWTRLPSANGDAAESHGVALESRAHGTCSTK
ncbi:hypothetical protein ACP70R_035669 [Stipagrostis hirtigluma subsp. patula]